ncbi:hypothetical protein BGZ97_005549, partial [Linnemannia gamsii]
IWIESRLRYIESAENLSYHIPGFRRTYDWFPNQIYFTVTAKEYEEYIKKHPRRETKKKHYNKHDDGDEDDKDEQVDVAVPLTSGSTSRRGSGDSYQDSLDSDSKTRASRQVNTESTNRKLAIQDESHDRSHL